MTEPRPRRLPKPVPTLLIGGGHYLIAGILILGFAAWTFRLVSVFSATPERAWLAAACSPLGPFSGAAASVGGEGLLQQAWRSLPITAGAPCLGLLAQWSRLPLPGALRMVAWALGLGVWLASGVQFLMLAFS